MNLKNPNLSYFRNPFPTLNQNPRSSNQFQSRPLNLNLYPAPSPMNLIRFPNLTILATMNLRLKCPGMTRMMIHPSNPSRYRPRHQNDFWRNQAGDPPRRGQ